VRLGSAIFLAGWQLAALLDLSFKLENQASGLVRFRRYHRPMARHHSARGQAPTPLQVSSTDGGARQNNQGAHTTNRFFSSTHLSAAAACSAREGLGFLAVHGGPETHAPPPPVARGCHPVVEVWRPP
jgi:hypothetical protein